MWAQEKPRNLHSVTSGDFPRLFFVSSLQGGASIVFICHIQQMAVHTAYKMKAAPKKTKNSSNADANKKIAFESTPAAIDDRELKILMMAR